MKIFSKNTWGVDVNNAWPLTCKASCLKKIELRPLISGFDFALLEVRNLCVASQLIIVIPTTSVYVLWDAIVPLSPTPTLIGSTICQTSKFIVFRNTSVVFVNINNKRHLSVHPKEYISFGKGVSMSFFNFLVLIPYFSV